MKATHLFGAAAGTLVLTMAVAPGASARTPHQDVAATSACYASPSARNCDNTDPQATGCSADAYDAQVGTVYWVDPENGKRGSAMGEVINRYSPHCGTNWSKFIEYDGGPAGSLTVQVCLGVSNFNHCSDPSTWNSASGWSPQLYAPTTVATAYAWFASSDGGLGGQGQVSA